VNVKMLKAEELMLKKMSGLSILPVTTAMLIEKYRRAFLNGGGTGALPAMTLVSIAVDSGAMDGAESMPNGQAAAPASRLPQLDSDDDANVYAEGLDAETEEADESVEEPGSEGAILDGSEPLTRGRLINFKTKDGWKQGRFFDVAEKDNHVLCTSAGRRKPFLVHVKNLDVPDLTKPTPSG
jgi:hypothetical protein